MSLCLIIYLRIYFEDHKIYLNLCNSYDVMFWHLRFYMFIGVFVFLIHMACITCNHSFVWLFSNCFRSLSVYYVNDTNGQRLG